MKQDVLIIGAGPSGIFTALEMLKNGSKKSITIVEKGLPVEKRHCPKAQTGHCVNCKPDCNITTGFSGAGAFSDGKLSLCYEVGGNLPDLRSVFFRSAPSGGTVRSLRKGGISMVRISGI